jgi:hypothetical protein
MTARSELDRDGFTGSDAKEKGQRLGLARGRHGLGKVRGGKAEERSRVADYTPYQRKLINRYYKNLDAIQFQRLSELATDLYLAEGKKRDRLWTRVEDSLRKLEFPENRIALLLQKRDPALLVGVLKELESGG